MAAKQERDHLRAMGQFVPDSEDEEEDDENVIFPTLVKTFPRLQIFHTPANFFPHWWYSAALPEIFPRLLKLSHVC